MNSTQPHDRWDAFLKYYSGENKGRKTRLGVFDRNGDVVEDYWIEDGLALLGIDADPNGKAVEILLDGYSHIVADARSLAAHYFQNGHEDGLDISDGKGTTTILRFES